jgi:ATP-dependent helicase YprA (DUF1998 family)
VVLELVLTRPRDNGLVQAANGLWFLVLHELHTYPGRQGADVALLVRRLPDICAAPGVQCVGTSATMTTEGEATDQKEAVAGVATTLFGVDVTPDRVIGLPRCRLREHSRRRWQHDRSMAMGRA